jgi:hypothetical protein
LETLGPYFLRRIGLPESDKIEIPTADDDFLDAEIWTGNNPDWVVLTHGLEGSTRAVYLRAAAKHFLLQGKNVLAWNLRACSGRLNRKPRLYHSGAYEDLADVIDYIHLHHQPQSLMPVGFSLGGNLCLLLLARMDATWLESRNVKSGMAISVPINLSASADKLELWHNLPYTYRFLEDLKSKIRWKSEQYPHIFRTEMLAQCNSIRSFDDHYTAPIHGFRDAADYYRKCSSLYCLQEISIPVKILLAENDPMLARGNYSGLENLNPLVTIEIRKNGGHCGFWGQEIFG